MIVTLSGMPGAGKSTVGKLIAQHLNLKYYSIGDLRGKLAQKKGITIDELNKQAQKNASSHTEVDEYQRNLGLKEDNFVADGWVSWHFIPKSFKIFLKVDPTIAGERVYQERLKHPETREDEEVYKSAKHAAKVLSDRLKYTNAQFKKYYKIDILDETHYDLVLDTTTLKPEEIVKRILEEITAWKSKLQH